MKKALSLILALVMVFAMCACGNTAAPAEETTAEEAAPAEENAPVEEAAPAEEAAAEETATESDKLILGTSADYAPFEFMYADENGDMVYGGIDVAVAQYIADDMGKELQVENMSFDYLLTSLAKGDYDMVIAAMESTEERQNAADFSDPYYTDVPPMILVKKDDAENYKTLADFSGKSVGAQTATTKLDIVNEQMEGATSVALALVTDLVNELVYGKVDAVVLDGAVALEYAKTNPDLVVADASSELGEAAPYCVAVAKGDPKGLLPAINAAIAKMTEENAIEQFIADADALVDAGEAEEVSAEAPEE